MKVRLRSRLRFSIFKQIDGVSFWDLASFPPLESQPDDVKHTVRQYDRIDQIAFQYYGDPVMWPIVCLANSLELLPSDLTEGTVLTIPSPRYITEVYFKKASS